MTTLDFWDNLELLSAQLSCLADGGLRLPFVRIPREEASDEWNFFDR